MNVLASTSTNASEAHRRRHTCKGEDCRKNARIKMQIARAQVKSTKEHASEIGAANENKERKLILFFALYVASIFLTIDES